MQARAWGCIRDLFLGLHLALNHLKQVQESQGSLRRRRSSENFITFLETCEKTYLECEYISFYSVVATHAQWIANYVH